jgi:hypothetical protein
MLLIHILGMIILLISFFYISISLRKKSIDLFSVIVLGTLLFLILMLLFQRYFFGFASLLGFSKPYEFFMTVFITITFLVSIRNRIKQREIEAVITELVKKLSSDKWEKKYSDSKAVDIVSGNV